MRRCRTSALMFHAGGNYSTGFHSLKRSRTRAQVPGWASASRTDSRVFGASIINHARHDPCRSLISNISGPFLPPITIQPTAEHIFFRKSPLVPRKQMGLPPYIRFDAVPYLLGGLSMDALVDKYYLRPFPDPRPDLFNRGYDLYSDDLESDGFVMSSASPGLESLREGSRSFIY